MHPISIVYKKKKKIKYPQLLDTFTNFPKVFVISPFFKWIGIDYVMIIVVVASCSDPIYVARI